MFRITSVTSNDSSATLRLEGTLRGPWVAELARACDELQSTERLSLDLSAVTFVDAAGLELLHGLLQRNVTLAACSALVAELLHTESALDGPQDAEAIVRLHGGRMLAVARRFLRSEEDCADAVQDAFLAAFRGLDGFAGNSSLGTWLHRIVVNVCLMKLRARSRGRQVPMDDLLPTFDETGHHTRAVRPWGDHGLGLLTRAETRAQVRACIDRLPTPYQEVLLLRDIEEQDTDTTAEHLGISPGAVKTRLHRARQALRTLLEPMEFGAMCA